MGIRSLGLVMVLFVALTACGKKTYKKFYELEGQQSVLIADQSDDAYVSSQMEGIIAALDAVPDNAREKDRARTLVATLKAEKARVIAARAAPLPPSTPPVARPTSGSYFPQPGSTEPVAAAVPDAGEAKPKMPTMGMDEADFVRAFGLCFTPTAPMKGKDGVERKTQQVRDSYDCTQKYGTPGSTTTYLFGKKGFESTNTVTYYDAGVAGAPRPAAAVDAGPQNLFVPGMPTQ